MRVNEEELAWIIQRLSDSNMLIAEDALKVALDLRELTEKAKKIVDDVYYDVGEDTTGQCWVDPAIIDDLRIWFGREKMRKEGKE
jgi:hypothetical protein